MIKSKMLMMVITSDTYPAKRNSKAQKKIYKNSLKNGCFTVWYKGRNDLLGKDKNYLFKDNDLIVNSSDDSRDMGRKTLLAFEWALNHVDFEYLIRPTPSSYVNLNYLNDLFSNNYSEIEYLYAGTLHTLDSKQPVQKINFISGSTLLLSKSVVEEIVKNSRYWDHSYWDDVALGQLMHKLNIKPTNISRFDVKGNIFRQEFIPDNYQYRCRADNHYNYPRFIEKQLLKIIDNLISDRKINKLKKILYSVYFEIVRLFYIKEFTWKLYLLSRKVLKFVFPKSTINFLKYKFEKSLNKFKHKRFKY